MSLNGHINKTIEIRTQFIYLPLHDVRPLTKESKAQADN